MTRTRPMVPDDHVEVLALNADFVELLSPIDEERLQRLVAWSDRALVVELDGGFAGFVLTFATGSAYDGENFAWFGARYDDLHYLDRIVLAPHTRRQGVASAVYDELERDCGRPVLCLEVNLEPPNEASLAFHRGRGYVEVGQRESGGHLVSMMAKALAPDLSAG